MSWKIVNTLLEDKHLYGHELSRRTQYFIVALGLKQVKDYLFLLSVQFDVLYPLMCVCTITSVQWFMLKKGLTVKN